MSISVILIVLALVLTILSTFTRVPLWVAVLCLVLERVIAVVLTGRGI